MTTTVVTNEIIKNPAQNKLNVYTHTSKLVEQGYSVIPFNVDAIDAIHINHTTKTISGK